MSTLSRQPSRSRRGRVLCVGDAAEFANAARSQAQGVGSAQVVPNLFDALGEVSSAAAGSPIATVIISDHALHSGDSLALESLRKLDPSLRLVLAKHNGAPTPGDRGGDWANRGFDECIAAPLSADDLSRFVDASTIPTNSPSAAPAMTQPAESANASAPAADTLAAQRTAEVASGVSLDDLRKRVATVSEQRDQRSTMQEPGGAVTPTVIELADEISKPGADSSERSVHAEANRGGEQPASGGIQEIAKPGVRQSPAPLGDTDLVDAILVASTNTPALALQLIAQQTGWRDLEFIVDAAHFDEQKQASVEVVGARLFGVLCSRTARPAQLKPWADWLARWLTLDEAHRVFQSQAHQDDLTGAWNRRYFDAFLAQALEQASKVRRPVTVMVFDLDNFKSYNDAFGHEAGDEILRETVKLLNSVIRQGDRVCRIGGDEFAVIFGDLGAPRTPGSTHPESVDVIAKRFQDQVCKMRFPKLGEQAKGMISISAGLATYPWDGTDPQALLRRADQLSLESKKRGKNAITLGPGTHRLCDPNV